MYYTVSRLCAFFIVRETYILGEGDEAEWPDIFIHPLAPYAHYQNVVLIETARLCTIIIR